MLRLEEDLRNAAVEPDGFSLETDLPLNLLEEVMVTYRDRKPTPRGEPPGSHARLSIDSHYFGTKRTGQSEGPYHPRRAEVGRRAQVSAEILQ